jgi:hypothetical protein
MAVDTGAYLVPAIARLDGLRAYYAAVSASGSMVHVSVWDSDEHADQMGQLTEMVVDARQAAIDVGVEFKPIANHIVMWEITGSRHAGE